MTTTLGDLTQIPVTTTATQGLPPLGDTNVTLYNQDITNLVYVSYSHWFAPGAGNSVPIQPLTSITISARKTIYVAASVAGVAPLMVLPEGSQANPSPAQIAAQINTLGLATSSNQVAGTAAINNPAYGPATLTRQIAQETNIPSNIFTTGVPLFTAPNQIVNLTNVAVASGATSVQGPYAIAQIGYEISVSLWSAGVTPTYARVLMTWKDSQTGITVDQQSWFLIPGADATTNIHVIKGTGPTENNQLTITLYAYNNSVTFSQILMHQNSRVYQRHDWRTYTLNSFAGGLGNPITSMSAMILSQNSATVATGAHYTVYAPLFCGKVQIWGHTSSNGQDAFLQINPISDQSAGLSFLSNLVTVQATPSGDFNVQFYLPRSQQQIVFNNTNASSRTLQHSIVMTDI